jgi:hypothetical protein
VLGLGGLVVKQRAHDLGLVLDLCGETNGEGVEGDEMEMKNRFENGEL